MTNIAIFSPQKNPYSETFIQAHKNFLKGNIFYYYGKDDTKLEGQTIQLPRAQRGLLKLQSRFSPKPYNYLLQMALLSSLKKNKIDVVLAEYGLHGNWILPVLKQIDIPLVVHFHGFDASRHDICSRKDIYTALFEYASGVIAVSREMETKLLEMGCPRDKLIYNVYGPHPEFLALEPQFSKKQIISIGRFTNKKAPYYSILAFSKIADKHPDAQLLMAGDGFLIDMCKNLVKFYGLESRVHFLGVITPDEYRKILSESRAFIQHSITAEDGDKEGTPLAVLEASAAGLPVISTYHAGIPDVIMHNKTGLLCEEHDVATMAQHLDQVLSDATYAREMGAEGKRNIRDNFSMERHISILQDILESARRVQTVG